MSKKQEIYNEILRYAILQIRMYSGSGGKAPLWQFHKERRGIGRTNCLAYLIHRIPVSFLEEAYTENDRGFLERAIPSCMNEMADELMLPLKKGFVEFYDHAPEDWKHNLMWKPSDALRREVHIVDKHDEEQQFSTV